MRSTRLRKCAVAGHAGVAEFRLELGGEGERHVDAIGRQEAGRTVRPFHHHDGALGQIVEAELGEFGRSGHPVEVGMHQREARQLVLLHQREGRARDLDRLVAREMADHRAHEGGLAGAEVAGQGQHVAGLERGRDVNHQPHGGLLVREHRREARATRRGQQHGHDAARCKQARPAGRDLGDAKDRAAANSLSPACGGGRRAKLAGRGHRQRLPPPALLHPSPARGARAHRVRGNRLAPFVRS